MQWHGCALAAKGTQVVRAVLAVLCCAEFAPVVSWLHGCCGCNPNECVLWRTKAIALSGNIGAFWKDLVVSGANASSLTVPGEGTARNTSITWWVSACALLATMVTDMAACVNDAAWRCL